MIVLNNRKLPYDHRSSQKTLSRMAYNRFPGTKWYLSTSEICRHPLWSRSVELTNYFDSTVREGYTECRPLKQRRSTPGSLKNPGGLGAEPPTSFAYFKSGKFHFTLNQDTTKLPTWKVETSADFDRFLNEQLKKLRTEHVDFYLLHGLSKDRWLKMRKLEAVQWGQRAIKDGRVGYLGFSFHDEYKVFEEILDAWDWPFCQIQYNYMDIRNQAGTKGLKRAAAKGTAVVVMEPILGGRLVSPPESVQQVFARSRVERSPVDWALQWCWNQPEVAVVLSGMSSMEQVEQNVKSAERSGVGTLSRKELDLVREVRKIYEKLSPIPCTRCGYCMPCPHGVNIPENLTIYNQAIMYQNEDWARREYTFVPEVARASAYTQCRECEEKCPQKILISEWMPQVHAALGERKPFKSSLR